MLVFPLFFLLESLFRVEAQSGTIQILKDAARKWQARAYLNACAATTVSLL